MLRNLISLAVSAFIALSIFAPETLKKINLDTVVEFGKKHMGNVSKLFEGSMKDLNIDKEKS